MGIFLEFLKVEMKEGILLMVTSLFIEQISRAIENHKSKTNPNAVNLEGSTITEDNKKKKKKQEDNENDIMDEYRTEFNQTQSSIVNLVSNPFRRIFECNQLQSLVNQSVNKTFFF